MGISTFVGVRVLDHTIDKEEWFVPYYSLIGPENSIFTALRDFLDDGNRWEFLSRTITDNGWKDPETWFMCPPQVLLEWPGWERPVSREGRDGALNREEAWDVLATCRMLDAYPYPQYKSFLFAWRWPE